MKKSSQNAAFLLRNKKVKEDKSGKRDLVDWRAAAIKGDRLLQMPALYKKTEFTEWE